MNWKYFSTLDQFPAEDLYAALKLRQDVFMIEQNCLYPDIDNLDRHAGHLLMFSDSRLAGYARILPPGVKYDAPSIGRIVVHPALRKRGYGKQLVEKSLELVRVQGFGEAKIEAQAHLQRFYESLGFERISDVYSVDDIPHILMMARL